MWAVYVFCLLELLCLWFRKKRQKQKLGRAKKLDLLKVHFSHFSGLWYVSNRSCIKHFGALCLQLKRSHSVMLQYIRIFGELLKYNFNCLPKSFSVFQSTRFEFLYPSSPIVHSQ